MMGDAPASNRIYYGVENKKSKPEKNEIHPSCITTSFTLASMFVGESRQFESSHRNIVDAKRASFLTEHKNIMDGLKGLFNEGFRQKPSDLPTEIDGELDRLLTLRDINYVPVSMNALVPVDGSGKANFRNPQGGFIYRPGDVINIPKPKPVYPSDPRRPNDGPLKAQRAAEAMGYDTGPRTGLVTPAFHSMVVVGVNAKTGEPLLWSIDGANNLAPGDIVPLSFLTKTTIAANSKAILLRNPDLKPRGLSDGPAPGLL